MVTLEPITAANWRSTLEVRVQPERLAWVASREPVALMLLAKSYIRPDGQVWHPLTVVSDGSIVGIVGVGVDEVHEAGTVEQTAWIHHFLIDEGSQGRGFGRAAMLAIGDWLRAGHPTVTLVGLNVLRENEVAFRLYASLGFEVIGVTLDDQLITAARVAELQGAAV